MPIKHSTILREIDICLSEAHDDAESRDFLRGVLFVVKGLASAVRKDSETLADDLFACVDRASNRAGGGNGGIQGPRRVSEALRDLRG